MKNIILLIFCQWFFSINIFQVSASGFDYLYAGGSLGGSLLDGRQTGDVIGSLSTGDISNVFIHNLSNDYFKENLSGEAFAGFGYHLGSFYAGLEVFGHYSRIRSSYLHENMHFFPAENASEGTLVNNKVTIGPWYYGIDIRPGFLLTPTTLFYGRVGITGTHLKFQTQASSIFTTGESEAVSFSDTTKKHGHYLRFGLGIDQKIYHKLALRLEYSFTNYRSLSVSGSNIGPAFGSTLTIAESGKVHLKTSELKLGLSYYFSDDCPAACLQCPRFCGWFLGAGLGGSFENDRHKLQVLNIAPGPESVEEGFHPHNFTTHLNEKSLRTIIWGGYSLQFGHRPFFAGIEIFGQYSPYMNKSTHRALFIDGFNPVLFTANTTVKSNTKIRPWQYGIQIRPGVLLTPSTLLFGTVGASVAQIDAHYDVEFDNPFAGVAFTLAVDSRSTRPVLRVGGGLEYDLRYGGWHLRTDYLYTNYRSLPLSASKSIFAGPTLGTLTLTSDSSIHIKDHAFTIGVTKYL